MAGLTFAAGKAVSNAWKIGQESCLPEGGCGMGLIPQSYWLGAADIPEYICLGGGYDFYWLNPAPYTPSATGAELNTFVVMWQTGTSVFLRSRLITR